MKKTSPEHRDRTIRAAMRALEELCAVVYPARPDPSSKSGYSQTDDINGAVIVCHIGPWLVPPTMASGAVARDFITPAFLTLVESRVKVHQNIALDELDIQRAMDRLYLANMRAQAGRERQRALPQPPLPVGHHPPPVGYQQPINPPPVTRQPPPVGYQPPVTKRAGKLEREWYRNNPELGAARRQCRQIL